MCDWNGLRRSQEPAVPHAEHSLRDTLPPFLPALHLYHFISVVTLTTNRTRSGGVAQGTARNLKSSYSTEPESSAKHADQVQQGETSEQWEAAEYLQYFLIMCTK